MRLSLACVVFVRGADREENLSLVAGLYRLNSDDAALDGLLTRVGLARAKNRVVRRFREGWRNASRSHGCC